MAGTRARCNERINKPLGLGEMVGFSLESQRVDMSALGFWAGSGGQHTWRGESVD